MAAKNVKVHKGGFLKLEDFAFYLDTSKVVYYALKPQKDRSIHLKFYDKSKKLIKPRKTE